MADFFIRADLAIDIGQEPCLKHLARRADFEGIRQKILRHVEEERRAITPVMLAGAGLARQTAA